MLDYLQKSNPYFNTSNLEQQIEHSPYYTDTDSIQIHKRNLNEISLNNEIGGISDDLGENCKILYGGWIAPKLYFLEYVEKKGDLEEIKYHLRGKGIPTDQLTLEMFHTMMAGKSIKIEMQRNFKRIHCKEFQNNRISKWMDLHQITVQYCEKDDKKCLGVAERFNRTIKLMIEKYLTSMNSNRWIDYLDDFVQNYNSSYHSSIKRIPERLEIFDEVDLIRANIAHNNKIDAFIKKGDFVRLLNKRGAFEKEGQRFTCKIYLVDEVGLNSVRVLGKDTKFNIAEVLKVSALSREIDNSLRKKHLSLFKADKRIREREGLEPDRSSFYTKTYQVLLERS
jgi:hypothetical protein